MMQPESIVRAYLAAMQARDFAQARALLADGFRMCFPGGREFDSLEALSAWAAGRYRYVRKRFEGFDTLPRPGGAIVYCRGLMDGEALDGSPISSVRFIDRFEVRDGRLVDQQVWNDLAEGGARAKP
jgi:limonene-1,2-epoxide hydrolase